MASPLEKKFEEYLRNIHHLLHEAAQNLDHTPFVNRLLDKIEFIKRNFILLNAEKENVFSYQDHLEKLSVHTTECMGWIEEYIRSKPESFQNIDKLKHHFFMLDDLFTTSHNLIKSFYPII